MATMTDKEILNEIKKVCNDKIEDYNVLTRDGCWKSKPNHKHIEEGKMYIYKEILELIEALQS